MPIYEYRCRDCHHEFELLVRLGASPPRGCPKCGRSQVERKLSSFARGHRSETGVSCSSEHG